MFALLVGLCLGKHDRMIFRDGRWGGLDGAWNVTGNAFATREHSHFLFERNDYRPGGFLLTLFPSTSKRMLQIRSM